MNVVLISGGSRGLGKELVRKFSCKNNLVIFLYKNSDEEAKKLSLETGAINYKLDISDYVSVKNVIADIISKYKHIDVLVNNAAISKSNFICDISCDEWNSMVINNLNSVFYLIKEVLPNMLMRNKGSIINISSIWGILGASCESHYSATKSAIISLTKSIAKELNNTEILINSISVGVMNTDMISEFNKNEICEIKSRIPIKRISNPEEIARSIYRLSCKEFNFISGTNIVIDGGYIANNI